MESTYISMKEYCEEVNDIFSEIFSDYIGCILMPRYKPSVSLYPPSGVLVLYFSDNAKNHLKNIIPIISSTGSIKSIKDNGEFGEVSKDLISTFTYNREVKIKKIASDNSICVIVDPNMLIKNIFRDIDKTESSYNIIFINKETKLKNEIQDYRLKVDKRKEIEFNY